MGEPELLLTTSEEIVTIAVPETEMQMTAITQTFRNHHG